MFLKYRKKINVKKIQLICYALRVLLSGSLSLIPTCGNLVLPVRLLVWADGRGTVARADSAASAELQGAPKPKLLQLKNIQKYHWVKHKEVLICCLDVSANM